jgi:hypothetical protein
VIQVSARRCVSALFLLVLGSGMTGCLSSDTFQVRVDIDEEVRKEFRAPSMVVYVLLCDEQHPVPEFPKDQANSIEKWVAEDPGNHYRDLLRLDPPRAKRFIVKPSSTGIYTFEFTADKDLRKTAEVVAIALFGDTSNHTDHFDSVMLSDQPDREIFAFKLTPNSIELLEEAEEE